MRVNRLQGELSAKPREEGESPQEDGWLSMHIISKVRHRKNIYARVKRKFEVGKVLEDQRAAAAAHLCRHIADHGSCIDVGELSGVEDEHNEAVGGPHILEVVRA